MYGNLSDFLSDHAATIRESYATDPRYADYQKEITFLLATMDAVRELPGLDAPPAAPNRFTSALVNATLTYWKE